MNKMLITIALMALALPTGRAMADPVYPDLSSHVVDAAKMLPADKQRAMSDELEGIDRTTGHQFVVATVPSLDGRDVAEYATDLGRHWKLGRRGVNDGVLLLWAPKEHKVFFAVGGALQPTLTDAASGAIARDVIVPLFKNGDFVGGLEAGIHAAVPLITPDTPQRKLEKERAADQARMDRAETSRKVGGFFFFVFMTLLGAGGLFGVWRIATIPKRRGEREEREAQERAAAEAGRLRRIADEQRERELAAQEEVARLKKIKDREDMIARETPAERTTRVAAEAAAAAALAAQEVERRRRRAEREAQEAEQARQRQIEAAAIAAATPAYVPPPTSSYDYAPSPSPAPAADPSPASDFGMGGSFDGGGGGASY